jgi:hypothetical protein
MTARHNLIPGHLQNEFHPGSYHKVLCEKGRTIKKNSRTFLLLLLLVVAP